MLNVAKTPEIYALSGRSTIGAGILHMERVTGHEAFGATLSANASQSLIPPAIHGQNVGIGSTYH